MTRRRSSSSRAGDRWRLMAAACGLGVALSIFFGPLYGVLGSGEVALLEGTLLEGTPLEGTPLEETVLKDLPARLGGGARNQGFHVRILSEPSGAEVKIQGKSKGHTPFIGNVQCRNEQEVIFEVSLKGFRPWVRNPLCRVGGTLEINARLEALP